MINATLLACLYHKYSEIINLNTLRTVSDSTLEIIAVLFIEDKG